MMTERTNHTIDILSDLRRNAANHPDAPCLLFEGEILSFRDFAAQTDRLSDAMLGAGFIHGCRVAIVALSSPLFFTLLFACAKAGLVLVPINNRLSAREIAEVLADSEPSLLIYSTDFEQLLPISNEWLSFSESAFAEWQLKAERQSLPKKSLPDDPVLVLYTSGTTGQPKGVSLTQRNLSFLSRMAGELWAFDTNSINLVSTPLFHIGGIGYGLLAMTQGGATVVTRDSTADALISLMQRYRITHAFFVPTVIQRLLDFLERTGTTAPKVEHIFYGAAPIGDALLRRAIAAFGSKFHHVYGMTETAGTVVTLDPEDHDPDGPNVHRLQSCGRAMPWVEIAIADPTTGKILEAGEIGEVQLRCGGLTAGYWRKDAETMKAFTAEGWLRTGDAGELDKDGYLFIRDRYKDMIVSGGENIYPKEIENVLQFHPAVAEVGVIGVPSERWGETPWAFVVLKPETATTAEELMAFTRDHLARYKCPHGVTFRAELPRNASGKLMKHVLRGQS